MNYYIIHRPLQNDYFLGTSDQYTTDLTQARVYDEDELDVIYIKDDEKPLMLPKAVSE
jgi:hypothetical protein